MGRVEACTEETLKERDVLNAYSNGRLPDTRRHTVASDTPYGHDEINEESGGDRNETYL